jgi:glycosyltransferase involved in cell wall biosynthesis
MSKKLNILHWPTSYPDKSRNQPYNGIFVQEHIKSTKGMVNNMILFISAESTKNKYKLHERLNTIEEGIPVTRFYFNSTLHVTFLNIYIRMVLIVYFLELILLKRFYPNVIHVHFFPAGEWASLFKKIFNIKIIVTEHWTALIGYPVISVKRFENAKRLYEKASYILPVSTHLGNGILQNTKADISHKIQVIHNCVDTQVFKPATEPNFSTYNIISVARLDEQKDIPTMLKAFQLVKEVLPAAKLTIIGGGDILPFVQLSKDLKIAAYIKFLGVQPKTIIAKEMAKSNLFILSSISENSPCVIGEAQCCGLPVVATDVGGVKELILEGAVVEAQNPDLLSKAIVNQLNKSIDKNVLINQAVAKFSYDAIGQQIYNVYKTVCAE